MDTVETITKKCYTLDDLSLYKKGKKSIHDFFDRSLLQHVVGRLLISLLLSLFRPFSATNEYVFVCTLLQQGIFLQYHQLWKTYHAQASQGSIKI